MNVPIKGLALAALMTFGLAAQQPPATPPMHAKPPAVSSSRTRW